MVIMVSNHDCFTGNVEYIDKEWSDSIINAVSNKEIDITENFRVGPWICICLTNFEEEILHKCWPEYCLNPKKYVGTFAAYAVYESICNVRYGRPAYMSMSSDMFDWDTGEMKEK